MERDLAGGFGFLIISRELEFSLSGYIIER